jgi:hypothetical protein
VPYGTLLKTGAVRSNKFVQHPYSHGDRNIDAGDAISPEFQLRHNLTSPKSSFKFESPWVAVTQFAVFSKALDYMTILKR